MNAGIVDEKGLGGKGEGNLVRLRVEASREGVVEAVWKKHVMNHVQCDVHDVGGRVDTLSLTWSRDTSSSEIKG